MDIKELSLKQEKRVAKKLNGKRQPASGATPFFKGDVLLDNFLVECKTKVNAANSYSIKKAVIKKAEEEAFSQRRRGAILVFNFGDGEDFAVMRLSLLQSFLGEG